MPVMQESTYLEIYYFPDLIFFELVRVKSYRYNVVANIEGIWVRVGCMQCQRTKCPLLMVFLPTPPGGSVGVYSPRGMPPSQGIVDFHILPISIHGVILGQVGCDGTSGQV